MSIEKKAVSTFVKELSEFFKTNKKAIVVFQEGEFSQEFYKNLEEYLKIEKQNEQKIKIIIGHEEGKKIIIFKL